MPSTTIELNPAGGTIENLAYLLARGVASEITQVILLKSIRSRFCGTRRISSSPRITDKKTFESEEQI